MNVRTSLFHHGLSGGSCTCAGGIGQDGRVWNDSSRCPLHAPQGAVVGPKTAPEDDSAFLARIREKAEDWRYSDEFIGLLVRTRWPRRYDL